MTSLVRVRRMDRVFERVYHVLETEATRAVEAGEPADGVCSIIAGTFFAFGAWMNAIDGRDTPTLDHALAAMMDVLDELAMLTDARGGRSRMDDAILRIRLQVLVERSHEKYHVIAASTPTLRPQ